MLIGCFRFVWGKLEHDPEKWTAVFRKDHAQTVTGLRPVAGRCSAATMDKGIEKIKYGSRHQVRSSAQRNSA
jgi:hypothetical protein